MNGACLQVSQWWRWLAHSRDSWGSTWCLLTGSLAVAMAHAHLWSPQWRQRLVLAPGARVGGVLLPESPHARKEAPMAVPYLSCAPQQWCLASLSGPDLFQMHPQLPHSILFRLSSCSQPLVLSLGLTSKARASASSPSLSPNT